MFTPISLSEQKMGKNLISRRVDIIHRLFFNNSIPFIWENKKQTSYCMCISIMLQCVCIWEFRLYTIRWWYNYTLFCYIYRFNIHYTKLHIIKEWMRHNSIVLIHIVTYSKKGASLKLDLMLKKYTLARLLEWVRLATM